MPHVASANNFETMQHIVTTESVIIRYTYQDTLHNTLPQGPQSWGSLGGDTALHCSLALQ